MSLRYQSAYLTAPIRHQGRLYRAIWRSSLHIRWPRRQVLLGVASWMVAIATTGFITGHHSLPAAPHFGTLTATAQAAGDASHTIVSLGDGPTGTLLPPGTLAPTGTYASSYSRGQCTWYVASRRPVPPGWGNARTWLSGARRAGWSTGTTPAVGAIAWTSAGSYGHVALVEAIDGNRVLISEMNYLGAYRVDQRWVNQDSFNYIY